MLDLLNRYAHGYVVVPVTIAFRNEGGFALLESVESLAFERLVGSLSANPGHLRVALRVFESLGWCNVDRDDIRLTVSDQPYTVIPDELAALYDIPLGVQWLSEADSNQLSQLADLHGRRWGAADTELAEMIDGALAVPLLLSLKQSGQLAGEADPLRDLPAPIDRVVQDLFVQSAWARRQDGRLEFTGVGRFLSERIEITGTVASYRPMFAGMSQLLFGDSEALFARDSDGHETHLDRRLNVEASGFQHHKYFSDLEEVVLTIFDNQSFADQPKYIADMGCGDGSLLKRLYLAIRDKSARGKVLNRFPLTLVGVDYNQKALDATSETLAEVPHVVIQGDIGDPGRLLTDMTQRGIDVDQVLHVRSFLDHDRVFRQPKDVSLASRWNAIACSVDVGTNGQLIPANVAVQSLAEHLERWAQLRSRFGLVLLEVHCLPAEVVRNFRSESENLHFDAYHAFSRQHLVEPVAFLMAAAANGLFAEREGMRHYPRLLSYTRITLNHFRRRSYLIRHARPDDVNALIALEAECWSEEMRTPVERIRQRLDRHPQGQFVLEVDGEVSGVVYTQRVKDAAIVDVARVDQVEQFHADDGSIAQLLGANVAPRFQQQGLGDQLLEFVLQVMTVDSVIERVIGVTVCKDFAQQSLPFEQYVRQRNERGDLVDPSLRFHESHGATVVKVVPGFRPFDIDNQGHGVLIDYDLRTRGEQPVETTATASDRLREDDIRSAVAACVRQVLGPARVGSYASTRPLMDQGLDSLDLLELRGELSRTLHRDVDATLFFQCPTPDAIAEYFEQPPQMALASTSEATAPAADSPTDDLPPEPAPPIVSSVASTSSPSRTPRGDTSVEPIAIVGMACRFPGAPTVDAFWQLLDQGGDAIREVPPSRWEASDYFSGAAGPGKMTTTQGGFLDTIDMFDAGFFNIAPREARSLDPQQRLVLEVSWEALEHASVPAASLRDTPTGVFVGVFGHDYELLQMREQPATHFDAYFATGGAASMLAGRLAYVLGLNGPAVSVDTACSSSLTAVHLGCQSLRQGEARVALAGGVNLMIRPELTVAFSQAGMLAADGRCKTFDAAADGYVRGEGCGFVVLKRLADAQHDGDNILAVIRGSAINQDGASNGLTAPNGKAQEALLRSALTAANVEPRSVDYLEAHGTGTSLGDPIEVRAAAAVLGEGRDAERPLLIGSVKTNIGHLEGAAGVAGLIKLVLAIQHESIPKQLHFREPNPHLPWDELPVEVTAEAMPWVSSDEHRRLGSVSSFGFSGSNAHVVVEDPPPTPVVRSPKIGLDLLVLSAQSDAALRELAGSYETWLIDNPDVALADVCFTALAGRTHLEHRAALVVESPDQARTLLGALKQGQTADRLYTGQAQQDLDTAWLFTGQGCQYVGMAQELYNTQPVFRRTLHECDDVLRELRERSLLVTLFADEGALNNTGWTQPALVALELSLARLWQSWGAEPDVVVGHSVGEYAAACVAGAYTLEDCMRLIAERGRVMSQLPPGGAMASVAVTAKEVEAAEFPRDLLSIAAYNGASTVISGQAEAVDRALADFERRGWRCQRLNTSHAFHSALIEPCLDDFERFAETITQQAVTQTLVQNLTGEALRPGQMLASDYWRHHARQPVHFTNCVETLRQLRCGRLLEIGPHPVLLGIAASCWSGDTPTMVSSLRRGQPDTETILKARAELYVSGDDPNFEALRSPETRHRRLVLPTYPFQRERYWVSEGTRKPADLVSESTPALPAATETSQTSGTSEHPPLVEQLKQLPVAERRARVQQHLQESVGATLELDAEAVDPRKGFFDLGMDSIMAVDLQLRLEHDLDQPIPPTLAMDYPRIIDVVDFVLDEVLAPSLEDSAGGQVPVPEEDISRDAPDPPATVTDALSEPIAIIGLSCRVPGAEDVESFWELLENGVDAIAEIPASRWDVDDYYDPDPESPGKIYTRFGGFVNGLDHFDGELFGISPREVASMDPQQRLLLEVSWEALERAAIAPSSLAQSRTGVYVGVGPNEYADRLAAGGEEAIDAHYSTGNALSAIAGRVAFLLGLEGPAIAIDTACSSSLVAVHQASQALRTGDCDLALAGGVNVLLSLEQMIAICRAKMLAPDGRCKTFDAAADGYVRGEGCGVVVLKRLSDAERDGDRILALVRGSAVNQDGASSGLTVPNGPSQERVIATALSRASVEPVEVDYLEAHGTGTSLGDPIEVRAAAAALGQGRPADNPLLIGSVKTNVGHLEPAAGIAGLIKVVLAMEHDVIPPHLNFEAPSPHIPWQQLPVRVTAQSTPWRKGGRRRIAGVSSFGFSGTNAHVVVEAPAESVATETTSSDSEATHHLLVLSATTEAALRELAAKYATALTNRTVSIADVCLTAGTGRNHLEHRAALVVESVEQAVVGLRALEREEEYAGLFTGFARTECKTAWLFDEDVAQDLGAAKALYDSQPTVRRVLDECDKSLQQLQVGSLLESLFDRNAPSSPPAMRQASLFALEMAIARLWQSWQVEPQVVLGRDVGEFAAACIAGVMNVEDGLLLAAKHGEVMVARSTGADAADALREFEETVAAISFQVPDRTIISGLTGEALPAMQPMDASYWRRLVSAEPTTNSQLPDVLTQLDCGAIVHVGPVKEATLPTAAVDDSSRLLASLSHDQEPTASMLTALAQLYVVGMTPDFAAVDVRSADQRRKVTLPTYAFQRQRYPLRPRTKGRPDNSLLGVRQELFSGEVVCSSELGCKSQPWIGDHRVYQAVVVPGVTYAAQAMMTQELPLQLNEVLFHKPLVLADESDARELQLVVRPARSDAHRLEVYSRATASDDWERHASAEIEYGVPSDVSRVSIAELREPMEPYAETDLASLWRGIAVDYGASFDTLGDVYFTEGEAVAEIVACEELTSQLGDEPIHPVLLDAATRVGCVAMFGRELTESEENLFWAPWRIDRTRLYRKVPTRFFCHAERHTPSSAASETRACDLRLLTEAGELLGVVEGFTLKRAPRDAFLRNVADSAGRLLHEIVWREQADEPSGEVAPGTWLVIGDHAAKLLSLATPLSRRDQHCVCVTVGEAFERTGQDAYIVDPSSDEHLDRLLEQVTSESPLAGIAWLMGRNEEPCTHANLLGRVKRDTGGVVQLVRALIRNQIESLPAGLRLITNSAIPMERGELLDAGQSGLVGLARVISTEQPSLRCQLIDVHDSADSESLVSQILDDSDESVVAIRADGSYVPRLIRDEDAKVLDGSCRLVPGRDGSLDSLTLEPLELQRPAADEVQIAVRAAGLNFRDVLGALNLYPGDPGQPGVEAAGDVIAVGSNVTQFSVGDRVLGLAGAGGDGSLATHANIPAAQLALLPDRFSYVQGATLPTGACTAQLAFDAAEMKSGERVLIHTASGGVGLAAIQLAQSIGAEVFATASSPKQAYLRERGVKHIYDSRTTEFSQRILADTDGRGVDVVVNTLTSEGFVDATLAALRQGGRFVELSKREIWSEDQMRNVRPDVAYHVLELDGCMATEPQRIAEVMTGIAARLDRGQLQPLRHCVYSLADAPAAFSLMQRAGHIGKIVLTIPSRFELHTDATYLVTGGLGALGLQAAEWLVERGARHIVLVGRRAADDAARARIETLQVAGCEVHVRQTDVADLDQVAALLNWIGGNLPRLRGILHTAGVLDDGVLAEQTWERFENVLAAKACGAWNLHQRSRECPLDFFVLYSSLACVLGSSGQGNYAAANSLLDGLAEHRQSLGLPALSVNWGPWSGAGMAASSRVADQLHRMGLVPLKGRGAFAALESLLAQGRSHSVVAEFHPQRLAASLGERSTILSELVPQAEPTTREPEFVEHLRQTSESGRPALVLKHVQDQVQSVLSLRSVPDHDTGFFEMGMDSLTAVELRNKLQVSLGCELSSTVAFDYPTAADLASYLWTEHLASTPVTCDRGEKPVDDSEPPEAAEGGVQGDDLEDLGTAELARLLAGELESD